VASCSVVSSALSTQDLSEVRTTELWK